MPSWYTICIALFAALGSFLFGFDNGIVTTTIAHPSWVAYMKKPSDGLTGAVVSLYVAGEAVGAILQMLIADKLGRRGFMQLVAVIVTIGTAIQTGSVNIGMFLAGRFIAGIAVGALVSTVPIYLIEISSPGQRGLLGGLSGAGIAFGTMVSNWIGFACNFLPYGEKQWRIPLALQVPWGIVLLIGLSTFMPDSPRQLVRNGKVDAARVNFGKIHRDFPAEEAQREFDAMRAQIEFEMSRETTSWREIFRLYGRRVAVSIGIQVMSSLTGVNVVQYYQTTLYKGLGMQQTTILALAGVYGTVCFLCNFTMIIFLMEQWGRRKVILAGLASIVCVDIYAAIMEWQFKNSSNDVGKGFAVLGIYLFGAAYYLFIGSTAWLYAAEVLPLHLRSRINGLASTVHFIVNIGITEAAPSAFSSIGQNYYYVFVGFTFIGLLIAYFHFPETRQRSLEEIAAAFGDDVVTVDDVKKEIDEKNTLENSVHVEAISA